MIKPFQIIITLDIADCKEDPNVIECATKIRTEGLDRLYGVICRETALATAIKSNVSELMPFICSNAGDIADLIVPPPQED